jgi:hypothetical protein
MAEETVPRHVAIYKEAKKLAMGDHPLAKFVPPVLLLMDALLCSFIISKVPCMFFLFLSPNRHYQSFRLENLFPNDLLDWLWPSMSRGRVEGPDEALLMICRHRNRLEGIHGAGWSICEGRARLYEDGGRDWSFGLSCRTCLYLLCVVPPYGRGKEHSASTKAVWDLVLGNIEYCDGNL